MRVFEFIHLLLALAPSSLAVAQAFKKFEGSQCTGSDTDLETNFEGTAEECEQKCLDLGENCVGFVRVNSGSDNEGVYDGKCFFRAGELSEAEAYDSDNRDCYARNFEPSLEPTLEPTIEPTIQPTPVDTCAGFNIDRFLNECSDDFPAEKEALEAVEKRVTQLSADLSTLESETATSANLAALEDTVDDLSSRLKSIEADFSMEQRTVEAVDARVTELSTDLSTLKSETATSADLAEAKSDLSDRLDSIELTLSHFASARMAPAQFDTLRTSTDTSTDTSVSSWILSREGLLIVMSLATNLALLAYLCAQGAFSRGGCSCRKKRYTQTVAHSDSDVGREQEQEQEKEELL